MSDVDAATPGPGAPRPARRPPVRRRGRARLALTVAGVILLALLVLTAALWLNRRAAAREVLVGWLDRQGIESEVELEALELDRLVARVRIGDPEAPDIVIDRVEMDYALGAPWSAQGLGLTPSRIRLIRPVAKATLADGRLSFGALDPLIERFTARPPQPDARGPLVLVERGRLNLDTDYGRAAVLGDARIEDGRLIRLSARMPTADFASGEISARGVSAAVAATSRGDRLSVRGAVKATGDLAAGEIGARGLDLTLIGDLPYPDLERRRGDGQARLQARFTAEAMSSGDLDGSDVGADLTFQGRTAGWIDAFRLDGRTTFRAQTGRLSGPVAGRALSLRVTEADSSVARDARGLSWRLDGPVRLAAASARGAGVESDGLVLSSLRLALGGRGSAMEASGPLRLTADRLGWGEVQLRGARGDWNLDLVSDGGVRATANGGLAAGRGAWPLLGAPARDDIPELAEMKRALSAFALSAPALAVEVSPGGTRVRMVRPVTVRPANGGVLTLTAVDRPVFTAPPGQAGGGALTLTATRGAGLPEATVAVPDWRLTSGGFEARLDGRAALDFGLARGLAISTQGLLSVDRGRTTFQPSACAPFTVERLELDANDVTGLAGRFCPPSSLAVTIQDGGWRAEGRLEGLSASAPFLALDVRDAEGPVRAAGSAGGLELTLGADRATVIDATTPRRFNPVTAQGEVRLADERWAGGFDIARGPYPLGRLTIAHDGPSGVGGVGISAPSIVFTEEGLQPNDLSPMAEFVGSPAAGSVGFEGRIDWTGEPAAGSSGGVLTIPGLDFASPAGPVEGLSGAVVFTSLAPLVAAPGQRLTAARLDTVADLTDVDLVFGLDKAAVTVEGGKVVVAGGTVSLEPFAVPLDPSQPFSGVLVLDRVQLGQVVAGAGFGDKVALDAVVSGRLPFTYDRTSGVRITGGTLSAVQPGRLSIQREALSGLDVGGMGEGVAPNTVQDLAYQAMENLSFDILSAEVNSLDAGRLGVLFRIRGRHDPPQRQELRIPLQEFISRQFLNRELPLPSDTQIDLTLDTTLNANQLVSDLMAVNRARAGEAATPVPEPTPPDQP